MCWCFSLGFGAKKERKNPSVNEKLWRDRSNGALRVQDNLVDAPDCQQRRSKESSRKRRSVEATGNQRSPNQHHSRRRHSKGSRQATELRSTERITQRQPSPRNHNAFLPNQSQYCPSLNAKTPEMWSRSPEPSNSSSSQEALLNPRPHRTTHHRQKHPKRSSQTTLRGRGAKLDPPRQKRPKTTRQPVSPSGWSFLASVSPKTPTRNTYRNLESSSRPQRSTPGNRSIERPRQGESRHVQQHVYSRPQTQPYNPNTTAHRIPDRRFAVLAATNYALEEVRREAFAQSSPPPRRQRLRRYDGMTIPTSQIPFNWDCVSSSQASAGFAPGELSQRRRETWR